MKHSLSSSSYSFEVIIQTMRKALLLYNPHAGKGRFSSSLPHVVDIITKAGFLVTTYPTQNKGDAKEKIQKWGNQFDRIIVAGGDGMFHEALNGFMLLEERPDLGFIPSGTANDFATSHGIPMQIVKAAEIAAGENRGSTDIGMFNDQYFSYVAAFGAITDIPYTTNQNAKNAFGFLAYVANALKYVDPKVLMDSCRHMEIETDNGTLVGDFLVCCISNSKTIGSLKQLVPKDVVLDDGLMEGLFVRKPDNFAELSNAIDLLISGNMSAENIISMKSTHYSFRTDTPTPWTLDGEDGGLQTNVVIDARKCALTMLLP